MPLPLIDAAAAAAATTMLLNCIATRFLRERAPQLGAWATCVHVLQAEKCSVSCEKAHLTCNV